MDESEVRDEERFRELIAFLGRQFPDGYVIGIAYLDDSGERTGMHLKTHNGVGGQIEPISGELIAVIGAAALRDAFTQIVNDAPESEGDIYE